MTDRDVAALSAQTVRTIIGPCDDDTVAAIVHTGATEGQLLEAFERVSGNVELTDSPGHPGDPMVARLITILSPPEQFPREP